MKISESHTQQISDFLRERGLALNSPEARELVSNELNPSPSFLEEYFGDGPLRELLENNEVTEILVNGPFDIWSERGGVLKKENLAFSEEEALRRWVRRVLSERDRKIDLLSPFADCVLGDGSRLHVAGSSVSKKGICVSVRKFPTNVWSLKKLVEAGTLTETALSVLRRALETRANIFVSGGTGTGKTTILTALLQEVPGRERIIGLEDVAELKPLHPHFISLEARPQNQDGEGAIGLRRLLKETLRMRPDRIVVGECRGDEAMDLLLALNSGHSGSMGTIHANSPRDALQRLETLALLAAGNLCESAVKNLILGGIQMVVQMEKYNGQRRVSAIAEVKGIDGGRLLLRDINL